MQALILQTPRHNFNGTIHMQNIAHMHKGWQDLGLRQISTFFLVPYLRTAHKIAM